MKKNVKKRLIDAGILAVIFIIAVIVFEYILNRGDENLMADIGNATLPRINFSVEGYGINPLSGYTDQMDVTTMRNSITPVHGNQLIMNIDSQEREVNSIDYVVYSLDGEDVLYENSMERTSSQMTLTFDKKALKAESLLVITLHAKEGDTYYYTRIVDSENLSLTLCLDYIYNFHEGALAKKDGAGISNAIEPSYDMANNSFAHVNIHSDYNHVTWGDLAPQVVGGERWTIQETNPNYTSVLLEYEVNCNGDDNDVELYTVREFFRVRNGVDAMYLLNYDRTMDQIFDGSKTVLNEKGVLLGITNSDVDYKVNSEGTIVSFVQANELWNYNRDTDELSLLFSFRDAENTDVRNKLMNHKIRILGMNKKGCTTFAVVGYMNRGSYEGRVGMAIYYYDIATNSTTEKAFIPSLKSADLAQESFGKLAYYSTKRDYLYMMVSGTLHEVDVEANWESTVVEDLSEGQYAMSEDGKWFAYQTGESLENSDEMIVMNLSTGDKYYMDSKKGESLIPLGFVGNDFVYGYARQEDAGLTVSGEKVVPMYQVEIRNSKEEVLKTYEGGKYVILGASVSDGMITLERGKKKEGLYTSVKDDYIANNEEKSQSNITLETYSTGLKEAQKRLTFMDGVKDKSAKVLKPKQVLRTDPALPVFDDTAISGEYYVYGLGGLQGIYENAGEAIKKADRVSGVVVNSRQQYVWERGNKYGIYSLADQTELLATITDQLKNGRSAVDIMTDISDDIGVEFTGCTAEEMTYLVNKGTPVIAVNEKGEALILIGYDQTNVVYLDVSDDTQHSVPFEEMDQIVSSTGRIYIGYISGK